MQEQLEQQRAAVAEAKALAEQQLREKQAREAEARAAKLAARRAQEDEDARRREIERWAMMQRDV